MKKLHGVWMHSTLRLIWYVIRRIPILAYALVGLRMAALVTLAVGLCLALVAQIANPYGPTETDPSGHQPFVEKLADHSARLRSLETRASEVSAIVIEQRLSRLESNSQLQMYLLSGIALGLLSQFAGQWIRSRKPISAFREREPEPEPEEELHPRHPRR